MVLDAGFKAAEETGREGIGVDLFFGGGEPDFASQAKKGRLVPLRVFETQPGAVRARTARFPRPSPASAIIRRITSGWAPACRSSESVIIRMCSSASNSPRPPPGAISAIPDYAGTLALADPDQERLGRPRVRVVRAGRNPAGARGKPGRPRGGARRRLDGGPAIDPADGGQRPLFHRQRVEDPAGRRAGQCGRRHVHRFLRPLVSPRNSRARSGKPRVVWIAPHGRHHLERGSDRRAEGRAASGGGAGVSSSSASAREAQILWFGKPGTPERPEGARAPPHADPPRYLHAGKPRELDHARHPIPIEDPGQFHLSARTHRRRRSTRCANS